MHRLLVCAYVRCIFKCSVRTAVLFDPMMASLLESGHETEIQMNPLSRSKPRSATSGRPLNLKPVLRDEKKQKTKDAPNESIKSKEEEFRFVYIPVYIPIFVFRLHFM